MTFYQFIQKLLHQTGHKKTDVEPPCRNTVTKSLLLLLLLLLLLKHPLANDTNKRKSQNECWPLHLLTWCFSPLAKGRGINSRQLRVFFSFSFSLDFFWIHSSKAFFFPFHPPRNLFLSRNRHVN